MRGVDRSDDGAHAPVLNLEHDFVVPLRRRRYNPTATNARPVGRFSTREGNTHDAHRANAQPLLSYSSLCSFRSPHGPKRGVRRNRPCRWSRRTRPSTAMFRNREQIEAVARSKAWARLTALPVYQMAAAHIEGTRQARPTDGGLPPLVRAGGQPPVGRTSSATCSPTRRSSTAGQFRQLLAPAGLDAGRPPNPAASVPCGGRRAAPTPDVRQDDFGPRSRSMKSSFPRCRSWSSASA